MPLQDAIADFVFAFDSFDHWTDKLRGFSEIRRILRPAGCLVVVKDGSVPGSKAAQQDFMDTLAKAGFEVKNERTIEKAELSFSMWECSLGQAPTEHA